MSSFGYCYNNPIRFVDPTGISPDHDYKYGKYGKITLAKKTDSKKDGRELTGKDVDMNA